MRCRIYRQHVGNDTSTDPLQRSSSRSCQQLHLVHLHSIRLTQGLWPQVPSAQPRTALGNAAPGSARTTRQPRLGPAPTHRHVRGRVLGPPRRSSRLYTDPHINEPPSVSSLACVPIHWQLLREIQLVRSSRQHCGDAAVKRVCYVSRRRCPGVCKLLQWRLLHGSQEHLRPRL